MKKSIDQTRSTKPRILLLGSQMAVAGAQHVLLNQADWLRSHGYTVTAAFLYDRDGLQDVWQAGRDFSINNLHFRTPGAGTLRNSLSLITGLLNLTRLLRRQHFQVIETFTHHSNLIGCSLAWLKGVPVRIASHHGRLEHIPKWLERFHAWMVNSGIASRLVVVSQDVARQAVEEGIKPDRLALIHNGVKEQNSNPHRAVAYRSELLPDTGGKLILSVGRFTYQKGHTFLLQAMPDVLSRFPQTVLALAGDGLLRSDLEVEAERLNIQGHVHFLGVRSDIPDLMAAADIFVLPSRSEGLPLVLLEAMSVGLSVIATDVPGVNDALDGGRCGIIIPTEDPQAISAGLLHLLADETLRGQLGQAARDRFRQEYTLDRMMSRYLDLLDPARKISYP